MNAVTRSGRAASPAAFRIKSVDHTGFTVSSLEDSLRFWVDLLGFKHLYTWTFATGRFIDELVGVPGAALRLAMVEAPGHMIELLEYTSPNDRQTYKPRSCDVGSVHVAFYVENIEAMLARVAGVGWLPVGNIQAVESGEREGLRLIYVRGPDGVTVELLQLPEDAPTQAKQRGGKLGRKRRSARFKPRAERMTDDHLPVVGRSFCSCHNGCLSAGCRP
jgi:catechol 2,3-dioxygenase-like lactoylglutathione lyase family enzyme